jgi:hypothetical protein
MTKVSSQVIIEKIVLMCSMEILYLLATARGRSSGYLMESLYPRGFVEGLDFN